MQPRPIDNAQRSTIVTSLFRIYLAFSIIYLPVNMYLLAISKMRHRSEMKSAMSIIGKIEMVQYLLFFALAITFIMWFRRAYHNLHQLKAEGLSHSEGWAVGAWFVPFLNLGLPCILMKQIWTKTFKLAMQGNEKEKKAGIVGWWWTFYLIGNLFAYINTIVFGNLGGDPEMYQLLAVVNVLSGIVDILSLSLIIRMLRQLYPAENRLIQVYGQNAFSSGNG